MTSEQISTEPQPFSKEEIDKFYAKYNEQILNMKDSTYPEAFNDALTTLVEKGMATDMDDAKQQILIGLIVSNTIIRENYPNIIGIGNLSHLTVSMEYVMCRSEEIIPIVKGTPKNAVKFQYDDLIILPPPSQKVIDTFDLIRYEFETNLGLVIYNPDIIMKILGLANRMVDYYDRFTYVNDKGIFMFKYDEYMGLAEET